MKLEDLQPRCAVRGVHPDGVVTVVSVQWFGSEAVELTYKTTAGAVANELLYRYDETRLEVVAQGRPWSFDGDGALFRLVSEAQRIRLAHLFDPLLAIHTSVVDPLPHQITGVYDAMLPRQPLRFLLADDPGAGKTIMAGLLIKELVARGELERCLIVCPGSLAEQWQDELYRRFQLPFEILTNDKLEAARTRNWFLEADLVIARLDKLSRDEDVQQKLQAPDAGWDLVVCDEAHKLSATFFGGEIKYTKRYRLGQLLSGLTRHFLLMTATPHNGKEEDFQLFLALLDGDRFEGRFRDGVHAADVSDLMRRMVKERLLKFDGKPLFPERIAYTVPYRLSDAEARLYTAVTDYVREEFNRAEALANAKRAGTVGFALTLLQRRLASSPEAIYQSLRRRRERLESRLRELEVLQRGGQQAPALAFTAPELDADDVADLDDAPEQCRAQHDCGLAVNHGRVFALGRRRPSERHVDVVVLVALELDSLERPVLDSLPAACRGRAVEDRPAVLDDLQVHVHVDVTAQPVVPPCAEDASAPEPFSFRVARVRLDVLPERGPHACENLPRLAFRAQRLRSLSARHRCAKRLIRSAPRPVVSPTRCIARTSWRQLYAPSSRASSCSSMSASWNQVSRMAVSRSVPAGQWIASWNSAAVGTVRQPAQLIRRRLVTVRLCGPVSWSGTRCPHFWRSAALAVLSLNTGGGPSVSGTASRSRCRSSFHWSCHWSAASRSRSFAPPDILVLTALAGRWPFTPPLRRTLVAGLSVVNLGFGFGYRLHPRACGATGFIPRSCGGDHAVAGASPRARGEFCSSADH